MSSSFDPNSQQQMPDMLPPNERIGWFNVIIFSAFALLVTVWFAWSPVTSALKVALGRRCATEARVALKSKDWARAAEQIIAARRWAPEDVEVIRVIVEFLKLSGSDPGGLAQQLRKLAEKTPLSEEEQMLLGRTLALNGKTQEAREVYEQLSLSASTRKPGLDLLSTILKSEGHVQEAQELSQRATRQNKADTPEARLEVARQDGQSRFDEIRRHAHAELWEVARLETPIAMDAVRRLAVDPLLTNAGAGELLQIVEKHAHKKLPIRLSVVSALMRLQPTERTSLVEAEVKRFQSKQDGNLEEIAYWLMTEGLPEQVFRLVPQELAVKSRQLYPILMQSMAQAKRWEELKQLLSASGVPVPRSRVDLAMAEVLSHLQPDLRESRQLIEGTLTASASDRTPETFETAASLAAKLNLSDVAAVAYREAGLRADAENAIGLLQKALECALSAKDSALMLEVSRKLHELRPASSAYADRLAYLRLILGEEIETVDLSRLKESNDMQAMFTVTLERVPSSLLRALAAYRMGDRAGIQQHLAG
ncbi:tetratricopeptide repeat protein, partial [Prosthecobacter sp.]